MGAAPMARGRRRRRDAENSGRSCVTESELTGFPTAGCRPAGAAANPIFGGVRCCSVIWLAESATFPRRFTPAGSCPGSVHGKRGHCRDHISATPDHLITCHCPDTSICTRIRASPIQNLFCPPIVALYHELIDNKNAFPFLYRKAIAANYSVRSRD